MAHFLTDSPKDIEYAGSLLRGGELVAIPTETVYGLAANAFNEEAVRRIFLVKGRPFIDPLIVHVLSLEQAETIADTSNPSVKKLAEKFCPGPLTMVLPKKDCVPGIVTAGGSTVAIRMPRHPIARKIIESAGVPLAAPSANPFGYVSPTTAQHVQDSLGDKLEYIVDGGECDCGIESTVVFVGEKIEIFRLGATTREEISACISIPVGIAKGVLEATEERQLSPGMLKKHYSPNAQLVLLDDAKSEFPALFDKFHGEEGFTKKVAFVSQKRLGNFAESKNFFWLSESGDPADVARSLFSLLRKLDSSGYEKIFVEKSSNDGIGAAINDRLSRAAAKR